MASLLEECKKLIRQYKENFSPQKVYKKNTLAEDIETTWLRKYEEKIGRDIFNSHNQNRFCSWDTQ
jgi:hypothetical protein